MRKYDESYQRDLVREFGQEILDPNTREIKSDVLGDIVFADPSKRAILNKLSGKRIFKAIIKSIFFHKVWKNQKKVVLDAPLLFESRVLELICWPIVLIYLPDVTAISAKYCCILSRQ